MTASEQITKEVTSWPGVEAGTGSPRRVGLHASAATSSATCTATASRTSRSRAIWHELSRHRAGRRPPRLPRQARPRRAPIEDEADVRDVIELLRLNYDRGSSLATGCPRRRSASNRSSRSRACTPRRPQPLPFAPSLAHPRLPAGSATRGNVLVYSVPGLDVDCGGDRGARRRLAPLPEPRPRGHVRLRLASARRCSCTSDDRDAGGAAATTCAEPSRGATRSTTTSRSSRRPATHTGRDRLPVGQRRAPLPVHRRHDLPGSRRVGGGGARARATAPPTSRVSACCATSTSTCSSPGPRLLLASCITR